MDDFTTPVPSVVGRYDPHFFARNSEIIETTVHPFIGDIDFCNESVTDEFFPSVNRLNRLLFYRRSAFGERAWCYYELLQHWNKWGKPEAHLQNAIRGLRAQGFIVGPDVVFCEAGPNATAYEHTTLHVFGFHEISTAEAIERMVRWGYVKAASITVGGRVIRMKPTADMRADVWDKSRGICWYCGVDLHPFRNFHIDHVEPKSKGGSDDITNLVPCCQSCNSKKSDKPANHLRKFIGSGVFWFEREGRTP